MYRNNLLRLLAEIWLKKITSCDGCVLLIFPLIFFSLVFRQKPRKTTQNTKDFLPPSEPHKTPTKTEKNSEKHSKHQGISLGSKDQGKSKHQSANKGLPLPLGRGVCQTKSKNGRSRPRKPFISRFFCAQRGSETMV